MKDLGTIRRIFVHHATVAKLLDETFFSLDIGIRNITDLVGMEAVPNPSAPCQIVEGIKIGSAENHFVPTRALAKGTMDLGSMKLIKA